MDECPEICLTDTNYGFGDLFGLTKELPIKWLIATGDRGNSNIENWTVLLQVLAVSSINRWIFICGQKRHVETIGFIIIIIPCVYFTLRKY